ncbi:Lrp/AsnC family transcriptional regulator [Isoptericola sp. BMS4]|uniref:Lrp/AsnC family transcriptional regulator n=1 Tax=Isoptericola sp. BMS4 TaxID=2527875 RepID=UPI00141F50B8|nr:Lrp/AsnC family transcriptional regulator [Isoptericola sp. BMS4]
MDAIDRAIVDALTADGRMTNVELADRVNLTPGPTLRRVQRLEADGVIRGYRAVIDPESLGRGFEVLVDIDLLVNDRTTVRRFEAALTAFDEVVEVQRLFGSPDYFVRVAVPNLESYERFHMEKMLEVPGIRRASSRFRMKTVKEPTA